jgi:hypothetical protein
MNRSAGPLPAVAAAGVALSLGVWLVYCFHFNFDVTDEGLYLYSALPHPPFPTANYYFLWFLKLNAWLDGGLLALRYATLVCVLLGSTVVFWEYRKLDRDFTAPGPTVVGLSLFLLAGWSTYSLGLSSLSYNTAGFLAVCLLFAAIIRRVRTASIDPVTAVHLGLSVALALAARISSGLLFFLIGLLVLFAPPLRATIGRQVGLGALAIAVSAGATYLALSGHPVTRAHLADALVMAAQSSHSNLLLGYLGNVGRFVLEWMLVPGLLWALSRRVFRLRPDELVDRRFHALYFAVGLAMAPFDPTRGFLLVLGQMLLLMLFVTLRRRDILRDNRRAFTVGTIGAGLAMVASVGTNNNLLLMSMMHALLMVPLAIAILRHWWRSASYLTVLFGCVAVLTGSVIYHKQYQGYYRSPDRRDVRFVRATAPHLEGVWIPSELDALLTKVEESLRSEGFSRDHDAVLAYADLPGIGAALGLPMFGAPWLFTGYQAIDAYNCYVIRHDNHPYRSVYLLQGSPLTDVIEECVDERLEPLPNLRTTYVGEFFHYWAGRRLALRVVGPFRVKPARTD